MPAGDFIFNVAKSGFARVAGAGHLPPWNDAASDFRCLFLGGTGSATLLLDGLGIEDCATLNAISVIGAAAPSPGPYNFFNGEFDNLGGGATGYTLDGMVLGGRSLSSDAALDRELYIANDIVIPALGIGTPNRVTHLLIYHMTASGILADGIPIAVRQLPATYQGHFPAAPFSVIWDSNGVFYTQ